MKEQRAEATTSSKTHMHKTQAHCSVPMCAFGWVLVSAEDANKRPSGSMVSMQADVHRLVRVLRNTTWGGIHNTINDTAHAQNEETRKK